MVVQHQQRDRPRQHRGLKDLARMNERRCGGADRNDGVSDRPVSPVEIERQEVLARMIANDAPRKLDGLVWLSDRTRDPLPAPSILDDGLPHEDDGERPLTALWGWVGTHGLPSLH